MRETEVVLESPIGDLGPHCGAQAVAAALLCAPRRVLSKSSTSKASLCLVLDLLKHAVADTGPVLRDWAAPKSM